MANAGCCQMGYTLSRSSFIRHKHALAVYLAAQPTAPRGQTSVSFFASQASDFIFQSTENVGKPFDLGS